MKYLIPNKQRKFKMNWISKKANKRSKYNTSFYFNNRKKINEYVPAIRYITKWRIKNGRLHRRKNNKIT